MTWHLKISRHSLQFASCFFYYCSILQMSLENSSVILCPMPMLWRWTCTCERVQFVRRIREVLRILLSGITRLVGCFKSLLAHECFFCCSGVVVADGHVAVILCVFVCVCERECVCVWKRERDEGGGRTHAELRGDIYSSLRTHLAVPEVEKSHKNKETSRPHWRRLQRHFSLSTLRVGQRP